MAQALHAWGPGRRRRPCGRRRRWPAPHRRGPRRPLACGGGRLRCRVVEAHVGPVGRPIGGHEPEPLPPAAAMMSALMRSTCSAQRVEVGAHLLQGPLRGRPGAADLDGEGTVRHVGLAEVGALWLSRRICSARSPLMIEAIVDTLERAELGGQDSGHAGLLGAGAGAGAVAAAIVSVHAVSMSIHVRPCGLVATWTRRASPSFTSQPRPRPIGTGTRRGGGSRAGHRRD